ncbi:MAG: selenide, water dikinase SelD, partial [Nitrospirota bacterium]|nr:selenide, water dikinase SelD [Nitrospirota bacterium]
ILTKPIGIGVVATAIKGKMASEGAVNSLIEVASTLNKKASEIMLKYGCHACTDITGFGLGGHLLEVARASKVEITIYADKIPLLPEAKEYALTGLIPAGSYAIKHFCEKSVEIDPQLETILIDLIFDPQTSGGLVISLGPDVADACLKELRNEGIHAASIIGDVLYQHPKGRLKITYSNS